MHDQLSGFPTGLYCHIDRESEVPADINVKVDLSPQLLQDLKYSGPTMD
jgi:hypothetical protein